MEKNFKWILVVALLLCSLVFADVYPPHLYSPTTVDLIVGPFIDFADGKTTIRDTIDTADIVCYVMKNPYSAMAPEPYILTLSSGNFTQHGNGYATLSLDTEDTNVPGPLRVAFDNAIVGGYSTETILPFCEQLTVVNQHSYPITWGAMTLVLETRIDDDSISDPDNETSFDLASVSGVAVGDYLIYQFSWIGKENDESGTYKHTYFMRKITNINSLTITLESGSFPFNIADQTAIAIYRAPQVSIAADGLNNIPVTEPSGRATTFREMVIQLYHRFYNKVDATSSKIRVYKDDGSTVNIEQDVTYDGSIKTIGAAE